MNLSLVDPYFFSGILRVDVGSGEERLDDPGWGGSGHFPDGARGHLVYYQDGASEEEEQDGASQQVLQTHYPNKALTEN